MQPLAHDYMAVSPPPIPSNPRGSRRRSADIQSSLARNVAVLFGVDVPQNPTGLTWVSDYNKVTIGEIGRGAPSPAREDVYPAIKGPGTYIVGRAVATGQDKNGPIATQARLRVGPALHRTSPAESRPLPVVRLPEYKSLDEISRATIQRYGPETKAALVLSGAQTVFSSLEPVMEDVLDVLGTSADGFPLADSIRVVAWATLVAEAYRCQPALFVAAVQARGIQRAALSGWMPDTSHLRSSHSTRTEFPDSPSDVASDPIELALRRSGVEDYVSLDQPDSLGILDRIMAEHVRPDILGDQAETGVGERSNALLQADLVNRWCTYLTQSADRGCAWVCEDTEWRQRWVEAYRSTLQPLATFAAEAVALMPTVIPYGADMGDPERQRFTRDDPRHLQRMLPRVPALPEIVRLPSRSQRAVVDTAMALLRVLRHLFPYKDFLDQTLHHMVDLSALADRLFGSQDPQATEYRCLVACRKMHEAMDSGDSQAQQRWTTTAIECLEHSKNSTMGAGSWVDLWNSVASSLNASRNSWRKQGEAALANSVQERMVGYWESALGSLGLPARIEAGADLAQIRARATAVASVVHNYTGFLLTHPDPAYQRRGIDYALHVVLPVREVVAQHRRDDNALRQTLQITIRGIDRLITEPGEDDDHLLGQLPDLLRRLRSTARSRALLDERVKPDRKLDVRLMASLALGSLCLLERAPETSPYELQDIADFIEVGDSAQEVSVGPNPGPWIGKLELDRAHARFQMLPSDFAT